MPVHRMAAPGTDGTAASGTDGGADAGQPDPLVLAGRLADETLLDRRREYLELTGLAPEKTPYMLCLPAFAAGEELDERVCPRRAVVRPANRLVPIDLLTLVASADAVLTSSPAVRALALGLGRPVVGEVADLDLGGSPARHPAKEEERRAGLAAGADRAFDRLHVALLHDGASRLPATVAERLESLQRRVATLEAVNDGLRQTLVRERTVMAEEVRRRQGSRQDLGSWSSFNVERVSLDLAAAHRHIAQLQAEIDRVYATRTMRALAPVRRIYGRVRRFIPSAR